MNEYDEEIILRGARDANFVMNHTFSMCKENKILKSSLLESIENQTVVYELDKIDFEPIKFDDMQIILSKCKSFDAAKKYKGKKVAVLNFADNASPGGYPYTANAQEECLCHCSTLYPCLLALQQQFYTLHKKQCLDDSLTMLGNDDLIYTPNVKVFKNDVDKRLLSEDEWFDVDVITSAAPDLRGFYSLKDLPPEEYKKILEQRIKKIFQIAEINEVDVLILGAWGCGVYENSPRYVAQAFMDTLKIYQFPIVEFAVYTSRYDTENYDIFKEVIEQNKAG